MPRLLVLANEATAAQRRVYFHLVDATDGITAETGEAGGQPQVSSDGGAWTNTGIGTLSAIGNGRYYADLTQTLVQTAGTLIETRYKSANTAECPGDSVQVVAFDPNDNVRLGLTALPNAAADAAGGLVISDAGGFDIDNRAPSATSITNMNTVFATDFATNYNTTLDQWNVNVESWNATAVPAEHTAGYPIVTIKDGTGTGEINTNAGAIALVDLVTTTTTVTNAVSANVTQISGDSVAADNAEAFFDGTGYAGTGNVIPTVTSVTNNVNAVLADTAHGGTSATLRLGTSGATPAFYVTSSGGHAVRFDSSGGASLALTSSLLNSPTLYVVNSATGTGSGYAAYFEAGNTTVGTSVVLTSTATAGTGGILSIAGHSTSNTTALTLTGRGTGDAMHLAAGATGNGMHIVTTNGDGFLFDVSGSGKVSINAPDGFTANITGNITGNLSGSVGSVTGAVGSVTGNIGGNVTGSIGSLATQAKVDVNAEVVDCLNVDTYAEIGQETPAATTTIRKMIGYLFKAWRNKKTQTSSTFSLFADDATTVDQKSTVSDDGTTFTQGEVSTGP